MYTIVKFRMVCKNIMSLLDNLFMSYTAFTLTVQQTTLIYIDQISRIFNDYVDVKHVVNLLQQENLCIKY